MKEALDRFWPKVRKTDGCWLWTASCVAGGYGRFWHDGRMIVAHRFAYEALRGAIPEGLTVDHLCLVRRCVNPAHMELVTQRVNCLRGGSPPALNRRKTRCPKGHAYATVRTGTRKGERYCPICLVANKAARAIRRVSSENREGSSLW